MTWGSARVRFGQSAWRRPARPWEHRRTGVWHAVKVLWAAAPSYLGAILVRGSRIDTSGAMRFSLDGGATQTDELYLPAGGPDPRQLGWPSYTVVQASGCYAYRIDGSTFSYTVVFAIGS